MERGRAQSGELTRLSHRISTTASDPATLTRLLLPFDLNVTGHAVARKPAKKSCHSNRLHRLVTKPDEITGLGGAMRDAEARKAKKLEAAPGLEPGVRGFAGLCLTNLAMPPRGDDSIEDPRKKSNQDSVWGMPAGLGRSA